jgi:phosphoribosylglycinamide formyltransferase-1
MRIVTAGFVARYAGRMLNVHPSLLPAFPGLNTHERALAAGVKLHGCSVHFVTAERGSWSDRRAGGDPGARGDSAASLAERVLRQEHVVYPRAVRWFLDGKLVIANGV